MLSAEQDHEVLEWLSKEFYCGTVVRKELIYWFARALTRRDGEVDEIAPDFADQFLSRHPELEQKLAVPSPPSHSSPEPVPRNLLGGIDRLRKMQQRDRTKAMFGENPPPPRDHGPFPEGEMIYHCLQRYVVRHGNTVTKYTTNSYGMDGAGQPNEACVMRFVKANTTIPVPEVISSDWDRITMEYVEGQTLQQAWPILTPAQRSDILAQLRGYIAQMRALGGLYIGRFGGQGVLLPSITTRSGGPFNTTAELHEWLVRPPPQRIQAETMYWHEITAHLAADYPVVFTHGDLASRNILVREGRIVSILDWEFAGWYPEYWEYVFALRGLDNMDWVTLGQHLPHLFTKRYDLEYILMSFILRLS